VFQPQTPVGQPSWAGPTQGAAKTDGFAIAGLVFAILGGIPLGLIFSLVGRSRIKASNGTKKGMGLVKASWVLLVLWVVALIALVALGALLESDNVDDYPTGPENEVALVIDRFEEYGPVETCAELLTPELQATFATGAVSCEEAMTFEGGVAEIDITSITIEGDVATVEALENGEPLSVTLVHDGTSWRIDFIEVL
jgi:hypothetical protein